MVVTNGYTACKCFKIKAKEDIRTFNFRASSILQKKSNHFQYFITFTAFEKSLPDQKWRGLQRYLGVHLYS
jgi:hypothetical protein